MTKRSIDELGGDERACPYCGTDDHCIYLLLVVDKTFRTAEGGILMNAFNKRWSSALEGADENIDERGAFSDLLDAVALLSDAETESAHEGAPGMSSSLATYNVKSEARPTDALARFSRISSDP